MGRRRVEEPEPLHEARDGVGADRQIDPAVARVLALQRSAGNAAVARQVAASRPVLAREGDEQDSLASVAEDGGQGGEHEDELSHGYDDPHPAANKYDAVPDEMLAMAIAHRAQATGRVRDPVPAPPPGPSALRDERNLYDPVEEDPHSAVNYTAQPGHVADEEEESLSHHDEVVPVAPIPVVSSPPAPTVVQAPEEEASDVGPAPVWQGAETETESSFTVSADDASVGPGPVPSQPPPAPRGRSASFHAYDSASEGDVVPVAPVPVKAPRPRGASVHAYDNSDEGDVVPVAAPTPPARRRKKGFIAAIKRVGGKLKKLVKPAPRVRAQDLLADDRDVALPDDESSVSSSIEENRSLPKKYSDLAQMSKTHKDEAKESSGFVTGMLHAGGGLVLDMMRFGLVPKGTSPEDLVRNPAKVREGLMKVWGWSAEDVAKYYDPLNQRVQGAKVKYITSPEELATYSVKLGSTLMHGRPRKVLDTGDMVSKASGPGWGIFVMDAEGRVYVGQHRVGLFHHSSFKAGGAVAAAGEMKVAGGKLVGITAKSGHYAPNAKQTQQMLQQLAGAGCPLAGVKCRVWIPDPKVNLKTVLYDADDLLRNGAAAKILGEGHQLA